MNAFPSQQIFQHASAHLPAAADEQHLKLPLIRMRTVRLSASELFKPENFRTGEGRYGNGGFGQKGFRLNLLRAGESPLKDGVQLITAASPF